MVKGRLSGAALVAACILLLFSCGLADLTMFPKELTYAVAERDVYGDFRNAGLSDPIWIGRIELLRAPDSGRSTLFVYAMDYGESALFAYDPDTLKLRRSYSGSFLSPFLAISPLGNYLCGGTEIDPDTLEVVSETAPTNNFGYGDVLHCLDPATSSLYVFFPNAGGLACMYFTPAVWETATPLWLGEIPVLADGTTNQRPVDLLAGSDGSLRLLFESDGSLREFGFPDLSALLAAFATAVPIEAAASTSAVLPGSSEQPGAWLTRDGTVRLSRDKDTRLVRHASATGAELDSWTEEGDTGPVRYHFFDSGSRWLSLSEESGTLKLLRTWW